MSEGKGFVIILCLGLICATAGSLKQCSNDTKITLACIEKTGDPLCEVKK